MAARPLVRGTSGRNFSRSGNHMKPTALRLSFLLAGVLLLAGCAENKRLTTSSPDALRYYQEGVSLYEKFYYREAGEAIDKAIRADSAFAMAWARRAMLSWGMKGESQSKAEIARALQLSQAVSRREQLFIRMWHHRINYAIKEAGETADSLIALYPDEREAYFFRGLNYEMTKNYDAAIRSYLKALDVDSLYTPAVMSLGYAYSAQGEQQKAIAYMERYIRLAPGAADPRASYADLLLHGGRYEEALEQYRKSLELKPDYWYAFQKIGEINATLGRLREAEENYHKSLTLLPGKHEGSRLVMDAKLEMLRADYEGALKLCRQALEIDSTKGDAAAIMVSALARLKNFPEAEGTLDRIYSEFQKRNLTETPSVYGFYLIKARMLTEKGAFAEALAACERSLQYAPGLERGGVYSLIADIRFRQGEYEPALDACEEALSAMPNNPFVLLTLLKTYHAKGDTRMTTEIGKRLLNLWDRADPDFHYLREAKRILGRQTSLTAR